MRKELLDNLKKEIVDKLSYYLRGEGIELIIGANDNISEQTVAVVLEAIEQLPMESIKLLTEIRVIFSVLGKPWQCDSLIEGIYHCLYPHQLSLREITVLLMSLHVETVHRLRTKRLQKKTTIRYVLEEYGM